MGAEQRVIQTVSEPAENFEPGLDGDAYSVAPIRDLSVTQPWGDHETPLFMTQPLNSERMRMQLDLKMWQVGPLTYIRAASGGRILRRTLAHIAQTSGFYLLSRHVSGRIVGVMEGVPFMVRTNRMILRNLDDPFDALQYPSVVESVLIPASVLGCERAQPFALKVLSDAPSVWPSLTDAMNRSFAKLRAGELQIGRKWVDPVISRVKAETTQPLAALSRRKEVRQSQLLAIQAHIENHLGRLDLCAEELLPNFGVSRATLYRLFEVHGGVRNYIVDRRLFRALLELSSEHRRRGQIQQAAKRWGFSSAANFNRSVQHAFGGAPGALFRGAASVAANIAPVDVSDMRGSAAPLDV